jgi:hypothetical protein
MNFTAADGQFFDIKSAKELSVLEIWHGNRTIDPLHVKKIKESLVQKVEMLNSTIFRVAIIKDEFEKEKYLIYDGQHRAQVLKEWFSDIFNTDFQVIVAYRNFEKEEDIIKAFRDLNRQKAMEWKEDPKVVAQKYFLALVTKFRDEQRGKSTDYFPPRKTRSPYISSEKIIEVLVERHCEIWEKTPEEFAESAFNKNNEMLETIISKHTIRKTEQSCYKIGFALALDDKFIWI